MPPESESARRGESRPSEEGQLSGAGATLAARQPPPSIRGHLTGRVRLSNPLRRTNLVVVVTPTWSRPGKLLLQTNLLLRMSHTLCHAEVPILWLLVETRPPSGDSLGGWTAGGSPLDASDAETAEPWSRLAYNLRDKVNSCYGRMAAYRLEATRTVPPEKTVHKAVDQRNAAIEFLRHSRNVFEDILARNGLPRSPDPVLYFADDDNEYHPHLFRELSRVKRVGLFPVGFMEQWPPVETPVVDAGKVVGFHSHFCRMPNMSERLFAVDMAGFAVRLSYLSRRDARFKHSLRAGYLEDSFLRDVTGAGDAAARRDPYADVEVLADGATRVLAWHLSWKTFPDASEGEAGFRPKDWHVVHTVKQPARVTCAPVRPRTDAGERVEAGTSHSSVSRRRSRRR